MKKILVTGFDTFGGEKVNPASEILKNLKDKIGETRVIKLEVPTVFGKSINAVVKKIDDIKPDFVLCIGQAGGRYKITVERVAINIDDASIPDNAKNLPIDQLIDNKGETAYFTTIPVKAIVEAIKKENIPAEISNSAGTYVCNHLLYGVLNHIHKNNLKIKAGFIHIPFLPEQVLKKPNTPYMTLEMMIRGIETAIKVIVSEK
jgi:pyroglutamyl-peptidase